MAQKFHLILASASPRRRQLLKKLKLPFSVNPSHVSEVTREKNPAKLVESLAIRKAHATAKKYPNAVVLGADTVVVLKRRILGKPADAKDAYKMLYRLSGTTHEVYTGVALVHRASEQALVSCAMSRVRMKKLSLEQLLRLSRKHLDKAGSYAIQEKNDPIARVVQGSYDNVVGLPVDVVRKLLKRLSRAA